MKCLFFYTHVGHIHESNCRSNGHDHGTQEGAGPSQVEARKFEVQPRKDPLKC